MGEKCEPWAPYDGDMELPALEAQLVANDWRGADDTTSQLLLEHGDEGGFVGLDPHEVWSLDCDLLRSIDGAWSAATEGRYGFTAQTEVLASVRHDGLSHTAAWRAFGARIGWIADGWVDRNSLRFVPDGPKGHLPWFPATFPTVSTGGTYDVLFWFYDHFADCAGIDDG